MRFHRLAVGVCLAASIAAAAPAAAQVPAGYRDLDGVLARMQEIADAHPAIARVVDITDTYGTPPTFEGRHLFALKISDNVAADEDEPAVLIVGTHHARELVAPVIVLGAAERITAGYGTDPRLTSAVNNQEIWIAPVWNPTATTTFSPRTTSGGRTATCSAAASAWIRTALFTGMGRVVLGEYERDVRNLQGAFGRVRG